MKIFHPKLDSILVAWFSSVSSFFQLERLRKDLMFRSYLWQLVLVRISLKNSAHSRYLRSIIYRSMALQRRKLLTLHHHSSFSSLKAALGEAYLACKEDIGMQNFASIQGNRARNCYLLWIYAGLGVCADEFSCFQL